MATWRLDPEVSPAGVGVDEAALDRMVATFNDGVESGALCRGAQMAMYRGGKRVLDVGAGIARERTNVPVTPETMFVIFSSTKGLGALAMLMLYERKKFHYDEPVVKYWPEFARVIPEKHSVTIRQVVSHRAGLPAGPAWLTPRHWGDRAAIRKAMEELPLAFIPGEKNAYHAMNFGHLVNELVERIDGRDCGRFLAEEVFAPLGLRDIYVGLPDDAALDARVAWVYNDLVTSSAASASGVTTSDLPEGDAEASSGTVRPTEVSDRFRDTPEQMHPMNRPEVHQAVLPAGGGISTARDLAAVYSALSLDGQVGDLRLCHRQSLDHITTATNRRGDIDAGIGVPIRWGTGFHLGGFGQGSSDRTFGHGGAGGQVGFADRSKRLAFAFVTNGERSSRYLRWRVGLQSEAFAACKD
jgi:CubicO group peptidase (beta-lactamase class C family)